MKLNNKTLLYFYVIVLFALTYLLAARVISGIKTQQFDYLKIAVNSGLMIYVIVKIVKLGKAENDQNE